MDLYQRLLRLLLGRQYQLAEHAIESMDDHDVSLNDIMCCLSAGSVRRSWPKRRKYEIEGDAVDGRCIRLVVCLIESSCARIITVYEVH